MLKKICFLAFMAPCITLSALDNNLFSPTRDKPAHIFVNNRILAKVNGKIISVVDVMKKLDMQFYRQFPQYADSIEARHQFYQYGWKQVLKEIVENELIMADAKDTKTEVSNGDIREEMEHSFGPNVISNLEKAGLSYDEAWEIIKEELTLQRMIGGRVTSKALRSVTPKDVKEAYEIYAQENRRLDRWRYQTLTIRGSNETACADVANYAYYLLAEKGYTINELASELKEQVLKDSQAKMTASEEFLLDEKEIAPAQKEVLASLEIDHYSRPQIQESRMDKAKVFRIFYLKEMIPGGKPPLSEVEQTLKNQLTEKAVAEESTMYIRKLKAHYHRQHNESAPMFPEDFQPFTLR